MKNLLCVLPLLCSSLFAAETVQGGFVGNVTQTPTKFFANVGKVNSFTIRVVPGVCSKVYIGFSNMNRTTLEGVIKVLYPNCTGGLSDEWRWIDVARTGQDVLDTSLIYLAADSTGYTEILWESNSTGVVASQLLKPFGTQGPMPNGAVFGPGASFVEAHIVPGMVGKVTVTLNAGTNAPLKQCYPNNGTVTGNITDGWEHASFAKNSISSSFYNLAGVVGEYMLVTQWQYQ